MWAYRSVCVRENGWCSESIPGDFPGEAPQKTHILTERAGLLAYMELGFRFERTWLVCGGVGIGELSSTPPMIEGAGEAPPDAILWTLVFRIKAWTL
jgi:hypothetical protein